MLSDLTTTSASFLAIPFWLRAAIKVIDTMQRRIKGVMGNCVVLVRMLVML